MGRLTRQASVDVREDQVEPLKSLGVALHALCKDVEGDEVVADREPREDELDHLVKDEQMHEGLAGRRVARAVEVVKVEDPAYETVYMSVR